MPKKLIDELLELLWSMREQGSNSYTELIEKIHDKNAPEVIKKMEKSGLVTVAGDTVTLKDKGKKRASDLKRRHRLAERLFHDVLEVEMEESEHTACEMEHILSPAVTDSVCSFLGHPPTCPHGKPIPRGECCSKYKHTYKPIVTQLKELEVGAHGRIVFIAPSEDSRLERLASLGMIPGSIVKLKQKKPSYVISLDETTLALDSTIAEAIYVKQV
jgi:DtxR family Mn-dependent transcriptional regulator